MGWNVCVCSHDVWPGLGEGAVEGSHYRTEYVQKGLFGFVACVSGCPIWGAGSWEALSSSNLG